jgi:DnaJ family protein A protein 2
MWCLQGVSVRLRMNVLLKAEVANRSGAKGSAKAKKCVTCDGKGWKHVYSQVSFSYMHTVEYISK